MSFVVVGGDQKFCILNKQEDDYDDEFSDRLPWIEAKDLEIGNLLMGYRGTNLSVIDIRCKKLRNDTDSYDMSLKTDHTFYIKDSRGNLVLTHNIFGIDDLVIIGIGTLAGSLIGGAITSYKAHNKGVLSTGVVIKGVLVGAAIGGVTTAVTYYGVIVGREYLPVIIDNVEEFAVTFSEEIRKTIEAVRNHKGVAYFVYTTIPTAATAALTFGVRVISNFTDETSRRENEDINFSEINFKEGSAENVIDQVVLDRNGRPVRDENGRIVRIILRMKKDD